MPRDNIIIGKFGDRTELSSSLMDKFKNEARILESILRRKGYESVQDWLSSNEFAGCGDYAFQDDLLDQEFFNLATDEGAAWLLIAYSE